MSATVTTEAGVELLNAVGLRTVVMSSSRLDLVGTEDDGKTWVLEVKTRQSPPTPADVSRDLRNLRSHHVEGRELLLYIVSHLTESLRHAARENPSLAVASVRDRSVILHSKEYKVQEGAGDRNWHNAVKFSRKPAWGRYALMRSLLLTSTPRRQVTLAEESGVSQAAISHILKAHPDETIRHDAGWTAANPAKLFDTFMDRYPGPQGIASSWFGLDSVREQAHRVIAATPTGLDPLLSGDVAADDIAPWRRPIKAVIYARAGLDRTADGPSLERLGLAESKASRATLEFVVPADTTIWATARAWSSSVKGEAAVDPIMAAWDIARSRGSDASEAVVKLRKFVIDQWESHRDAPHR